MLGRILIIAVEKGHKQSLAGENTRIAASCHPTVDMAEIPDRLARVDVFLHHLRGVVGGTIVDHHRLPVGISLGDQRSDRPVKKMSALVGADHDAEEGNMHTVRNYDLRNTNLTVSPCP